MAANDNNDNVSIIDLYDQIYEALPQKKCDWTPDSIIEKVYQLSCNLPEFESFGYNKKADSTDSTDKYDDFKTNGNMLFQKKKYLVMKNIN